jgi:hypothetical protein
LAYNLADFLRRLAVPKSVSHWTLTTLREKLIKIGAKEDGSRAPKIRVVATRGGALR